jgi:hypothetical protein
VSRRAAYRPRRVLPSFKTPSSERASLPSPLPTSECGLVLLERAIGLVLVLVITQLFKIILITPLTPTLLMIMITVAPLPPESH